MSTQNLFKETIFIPRVDIPLQQENDGYQDVRLLIGSPGLQIFSRFERPSAERRSQPDIAKLHIAVPGSASLSMRQVARHLRPHRGSHRALPR